MRKLFDGKTESYTALPSCNSISIDQESAYLHITSNETIGGVQWKCFPETGGVPLVADMSSDIMSRQIDVNRFGLIYAGAQKNMGPAGATIVIIRDDLIERCPDSLPAYLSYKTHADKESLYNTPPVFSIYAVHHILKYIKDSGGIVAVEKNNIKKAQALYSVIDSSNSFYQCPVNKNCRSDMNIIFRLPSELLDKKFLTEANEEGMIGLKGYRSIGGCRASIYNAMPVEGVERLASFMKEFLRKNG